MAAEPVVIIGAGPAGFSTAQAYREHGGRRDVLLVGAEPHLPYRRPPLTKEFMRDEIQRAELLIEDEQWFAGRGIDLELGVRAVALDAERLAVSLSDGRHVEGSAVVLCTGAEPLRPDLPGLDDERVMTMRALEDSIGITERIGPDSEVLVLGTGFIGCEIAASLAMRGARPALIGQERVPQEGRLGPDAGERIAAWLQEAGVELVMDAEAVAVDEGRIVELDDGRRLRGDLVVLGMGVQPRSELAANAGLRVSDGAIIADAQLRARGEVYAAGDVALAENRAAGRPIRVEHWGDALGHGAVVGRVLAGEDAYWEEVPGFWSTIGERTLKYAAWGDGYDSSRMVDHGGGAFTAWYQRDGRVVGVLTHDADDDYERGRDLIARGERITSS